MPSERDTAFPQLTTPISKIGSVPVFLVRLRQAGGKGRKDAKGTRGFSPSNVCSTAASRSSEHERGGEGEKGGRGGKKRPKEGTGRTSTTCSPDASCS